MTADPLLDRQPKPEPTSLYVWAAVACVAMLTAGFGAGFVTGATVEAANSDCSIAPTCGNGVVVYQDEHDGDQKQVTIAGSSLTILPYNNTEVWVVSTSLDTSTCAANVDFNVPGKPDPPPVNLTMTIWSLGLRQPCSTKSAAIFTDPTGTLNPPGAAPGFPLNTWVELPSES